MFGSDGQTKPWLTHFTDDTVATMNGIMDHVLDGGQIRQEEEEDENIDPHFMSKPSRIRAVRKNGDNIQRR